MKLRNVDRAYNWLRQQPRRPHHYRDEIWTALVAQHPDEFEQTEERKTPWYSLHRDMSKDDRFLRGERGMFELAGGGYRLTEAFGSDLKAHPGHPQNRGEKPFRARLLQYLEGIRGGAR